MFKNLVLAVVVAGAVGILGYGAYRLISRPEKADPEKPYSLLLNRFRQLPDAKTYTKKATAKITKKPYIVTRKTSSSGIWHEVHAGASKSKAEIEILKDEVDSVGIPNKGIKDYNKYASSVLPEKVLRAEEAKEKYVAPSRSRPEIGQVNIDLIGMFPEAPDYAFEQLHLVDLPDEGDSQLLVLAKAMLSVQVPDSSLPLGVKKEKLYPETTVFGAARYRDNFSGDDAWVIAGLVKDAGKVPDFIQSFDAEVTRKAGSGTEVAWKLDGEPFVGKWFIRGQGLDKTALLFLVEDASPGRFYLVALQNRDADAAKEFMNSVSFGDGLWKRTEVADHVYTLPGMKNPDEVFYSYSLARLTDRYAVEKGNAEWAERMVGHWNASGLYLSPHGSITYGYFDLAYLAQARTIYDQLYLRPSDNPWVRAVAAAFSVTVKGNQGRYVPNTSWDDVYQTEEVNFRVGKHVVGVNFGGYNGSLGKEALIEMAEKMQL